MYSQTVTLVILSILQIQALPPELYTESDDVNFEEFDLGRRSFGERKFKAKIFGEHVELKLKKSEEFLPETLPVHFLDVDNEGNVVVNDYTHRTKGKHLYGDIETGASFLIDELAGQTKIHGNMMGKYVVEPIHDAGNEDVLIVPPRYKSSMKHRVYRTRTATNYTLLNDFIPQTFVESDVESDGEFKKRAIPSKIYPSIRAVVDYSHYKKLQLGGVNILDYIKILYHTAQVAHFSTMTNPSCQISLQGITVCQSDAACTELNKGKWTYEKYKYPMDNIGKFAYQIRGYTGTDYDLMFVTTSNKICPTVDNCGVGGFGPMPGTCSPFNPTYQNTGRGGIMIDHGGYDAVRGLGHEIGHMLNMPHDGDDNYPYARSCKGGTPQGDYIMGQTKYSPHNWRYSSCSMHYLHQWLSQSKSDCVKTPPPKNVIYGWNDQVIAGKYMFANNQCKAIFGSGWKSCQSTLKKNEKICQHLGCNKDGPGNSWCSEFHLAAAEGTSCGPGLHCMKGYCVTDPYYKGSSSGGSQNTGSSSGGSITSAGNSGGCVDTNPSSCSSSTVQWMIRTYPGSCYDKQTISECCATTKDICSRVHKLNVQPIG